MGRPSKLTDEQWSEIGRRRLAGEKDRALGKAFGISEAAIRARFSAQHRNVKAVAHQLVSAEQALRELPVSAQLSALQLVDELRAISMHLAGAAKFGAATAHRLAGIAHGKVAEIDDAAPLDDESLGALRGVAVLTKLANDASHIGVNLLSANKEQIQRMNAPPEGEDDDDDALALARAQRLEALAADGAGATTSD
ncbi:MAG: Hin recombinase [Burkholderiales bacterium]|nr:Hin recombinase [Burkholderiales bacterium]